MFVILFCDDEKYTTCKYSVTILKQLVVRLDLAVSIDCTWHMIIKKPPPKSYVPLVSYQYSHV